MGRKVPNILTTPPLRSKWSKAKKLAKNAAADLDKKNGDKKKKQAKAFKAMAKTFKQDLGPNLDKWSKLYPDFQKMERLLSKAIRPVIKHYLQAAKDAPIDKSIKGDLRKTLKFILRQQKIRALKAQELINSDLSLGLKISKEEAKLPPPILVFKFPDIMRLVQSRAGKLEHIDVGAKLSLEVILDSKEVRARFPIGKEHIDPTPKIKAAGDLGRLVADIADALKVADRNVGKGRKVADEQKRFEKKVDRAIGECVVRATGEAARLGKLKRNARWANVKRGGGLVFTGVSAVGGVVGATTTGVALTAATSGAAIAVGITSIAVSCVGLVKSAIDISKQIVDIASSAEIMAKRIALDLKIIEKTYKKWLKSTEVKNAGGVSKALGSGEFLARGFNNLVGPVIPTLKRVKGDVGTFDEKINNLEVNAGKLAEKITAFLAQQNKANGELKKLKKLGRDALSDKELNLRKMILVSIEKSSKQVDTTIKGVINLNKRVKVNRIKFKELDKQLKKISKSKPLWSDIGSALVEATSGLLTGAAVGVADVATGGGIKSIADLAHTIFTTTTDTLDRALELKEYSGDLNDAFGEEVKRARAKMKKEKKEKK